MAVHVAGERHSPLLGREDECSSLEVLLESVRGGLSGVLVLAGEPGVGKTRLLDHAASRSADLRVLAVVGMESETQLGFAGLHRLLLPFLDHLAELPPPQREALGSAFGLVAGPPPDRFLAGLAALTLLSGVARDQPLLCLVDDVHWLDRESVEVLAFVARRLHADGIGMLLSTREEQSPALVGLPVLTLQGLTEPDARRLLAAAAGPVDAHTVGRVVSETGGNPLALLELGAELAAGPLSPSPLPVGPRMEAHFLRQVRALPAETQSLLLLVAVASTGDPGTLWRAAATLGLSPEAADPAVAAGILAQPNELVFRHPLIRSAVYGGAAPVDRRRVHRVLAEATGPGSNQRIWHLAEATAGVDEAIAAELEQASERAGGRGGFAAQAIFLSRAAAMTPDPQDRTRRLVTAAQAHLVIGDTAMAQTTLERLDVAPETPVGRAAVQRLRALIVSNYGQITLVPSILMDAIVEAAPDDERLARNMAFDALSSLLVTREHAVGVTLEEFSRAIRAMRWEVSASSSVTDLLVDAFTTRIAEGHAAAVPRMRAAVAALCADDLLDMETPIAFAGCAAADEAWDYEGYRRAAEHVAALSRERGALYSLATALKHVASCEVYAGRFDQAESLLGESREVAQTMCHLEGPGHQVELLAWQGREAETREAAEISIREWGEQFGLAIMTNHAHYSLSTLELSLGRYEEALAVILPVFHEDLPGEGNRMLPNVVEAGVRAGDLASAEAALARLADQAAVTATPWVLGVLARSRALLTGDDQAETLFQEAVAQLGTTPIVTELARTHLLYGEWLRRRKRRNDARVQLRTAHDLFTTMGAAAFAERAATELLATGETARKRSPHTENDLTPQEKQVAGLAADGATNTEIATRLFITTSTVEYHLNKIFRKLSITSRRQLAAALRE